MDCLVSVIIPVYNIEKYLRKCLDSMINQTLKNIEIIVVDDGSTDGSGQICDEYAARDERIRVLHKANGGISSARNDGVKMSTAPYIMFVDGDDWVEPEFCEIPYKTAIENNADLVLFLYNRVYHDGRTKLITTDREDGIITEEEALHFNIFVCGSVWNILYDRKICEKVKYPDGRVHEDTATSHRFVHAASKIYLLNKHLYNYRTDRPGSIMNPIDKKEHPDLKEMLVSRTFDLSEWGFRDLAQLYTLRLLVRYELSKQDAAKLGQILKTGKAPKFFKPKFKVMLYIYRISPWIFGLICKFMRY